MVNEIPLDNVDDVPVVEPNQHDDVPVVPELVLEDEDEDPEEDEFEEEEDPQEEEDDMEIDIEEDENEPELTYLYEEVDPVNPLPPVSESEPDNEIEVENLIKHEDETVVVSVYEVGESSTAAIPREDGDRLLPGFMRQDIDSLFGRMVNFSRRLCGRETAHALVEKKGNKKDKFYGKLILDLGNEVYSSVEQGTAAMEKLVEKLGSVEEKAQCKKLKKELEEARLSNTFLQSVDAVIAAEQERWNYKIATIGLETVNQMPWTEMKKLVTAEFCPIEEIQCMEHELWNLKVKEYNIVAYTHRFNELALMCPRMVELERVMVDAYNRGLMDNIKGEVTSFKLADLNEAVRMAHKLMEQKLQARNEKYLEGKKRKWECFQSRNSSGKGNQKDNTRQTL
ncbi:putative reverse transcriptase domain-containing protein [Tanacetum coccineum]